MKFRLLLVMFVSFFLTTNAMAEQYYGIEFPQGAASFADEVIYYQPTINVHETYSNPSHALGIPDFNGNYYDGSTYVSLGDQGVLIVKFTDNALTTSSNNNMDLWIFEIGPAVEPTAVAISKNGTDWINVGQTEGSTRGVDIDAYLGSGVVLGDKYSYVKLTDLLPHQSDSPYEGADIDAVGAISSTSPAVPIPGAIWLLGSGLLSLIALRKKVD